MSDDRFTIFSDRKTYLSSLADDIIQGKEDWLKNFYYESTLQGNEDLIKKKIWIISFCSWMPIFNCLLSMATLESFIEKERGMDDGTSCKEIGYENILFWTVICIYLVRFLIVDTLVLVYSGF